MEDSGQRHALAALSPGRRPPSLHYIVRCRRVKHIKRKPMVLERTGLNILTINLPAIRVSRNLIFRS